MTNLDKPEEEWKAEVWQYSVHADKVNATFSTGRANYINFMETLAATCGAV